MAQNEPMPPSLRRQVPTGVSIAAIVLAVLGVLYIVGKATPSGPQSPFVGRQAGDFTAAGAGGGDIRLSDYKGKVILLNFWATWCGPCKMEMPDLIALQKKYGEKNFTVLGLSDDDAAGTAGGYIKANGINYPNGMATREIKNQFGGVAGLPTSVLIDKSGKIVKVLEGIDPSKSIEAMWSEEIDKLL